MTADFEIGREGGRPKSHLDVLGEQLCRVRVGR